METLVNLHVKFWWHDRKPFAMMSKHSSSCRSKRGESGQTSYCIPVNATWMSERTQNSKRQECSMTYYVRARPRMILTFIWLILVTCLIPSCAWASGLLSALTCFTWHPPAKPATPASGWRSCLLAQSKRMWETWKETSTLSWSGTTLLTKAWHMARN